MGKVRVVDNLSTGYYDNIKMYINAANFEFIEGDLTNSAFCKEI